jgi:hypothetical protein
MPSDRSVSPQLRFRRIFTSTQKVASVTFILFSALAYAKESSLLTSISGLWQFEDKNVWIQIDEKGVAYQCRIGRERNGVFREWHLRFSKLNRMEKYLGH